MDSGKQQSAFRDRGRRDAGHPEFLGQPPPGNRRSPVFARDDAGPADLQFAGRFSYRVIEHATWYDVIPPYELLLSFLESEKKLSQVI